MKQQMQPGNVFIDKIIRPSDVAAIHLMVEATGVFNEEEIAVACEIAEDTLSGKDDDYNFIFLRNENGVPFAYTCYGAIPLTDKRFDIYWIAVSPQMQGQGLGAKVLAATEKHVQGLGGIHIYAETSGKEPYKPAQNFYIKNGFKLVANIKDFYRNGDDKIIYQKHLYFIK